MDRRPELIRICNKTFNRILEKEEEICNEGIPIKHQLIQLEKDKRIILKGFLKSWFANIR